MTGWERLHQRIGFADEYPFQSRWIDVGEGKYRDAVRYHYVDEGTGPVLLCVHGNPTWSFAYRHVVRELSAKYRVIAVDHIGCGMSDKPDPYPYTLDRHISNLEAFITRLDLRDVTLAVHDWGGAIGFGAAARLPERIRAFVVSNTAAFPSERIPFRIAVCRWPVVGTLALRGLNAFSRAALTMAVESRRNLTPAARVGYIAPYYDWGSRVAVDRFVKDIPMTDSHPSRAALETVERSLGRWRDTPMMLMWGLRDWCFSVEFLAEFVRRFPNAQTVTFEHAGHYLFEDEKGQYVAHIERFMNSLSR